MANGRPENSKLGLWHVYVRVRGDIGVRVLHEVNSELLPFSEMYAALHESVSSVYRICVKQW